MFLFQKYTPPVCLSSTAVHVSLGSLLIIWFALSLSWLVGCCASALPGGALLLLLRELLSAIEQVWKLSPCKSLWFSLQNADSGGVLLEGHEQSTLLYARSVQSTWQIEVAAACLIELASVLLMSPVHPALRKSLACFCNLRCLFSRCNIFNGRFSLQL